MSSKLILLVFTYVFSECKPKNKSTYQMTFFMRQNLPFIRVIIKHNNRVNASTIIKAKIGNKIKYFIVAFLVDN